MNPDPWQIAAEYGLVGLLLATFGIGFIREWWVLGRELRAEQRERQKSEARERYWMQLAIGGTELAKTSLEIQQAEQRRLP